MTRLVDFSNSPHYRWGDVCDGWRLLDQPDLTVIEERMPPGSSERMHRHRAATQLFYVLEGELTIATTDKSETIPKGRGIVIEPWDFHEARNVAATDARFLVISAPSTTHDREPA